MVFASRGREGGGELRVAQRANQGDDAARDPRGDEERWALDRAGDDRGRAEDPGADDQADDDGGGVAEREDLRRAGMLRWFVRGHLELQVAGGARVALLEGS